MITRGPFGSAQGPRVFGLASAVAKRLWRDRRGSLIMMRDIGDFR